MQLQNDNLIKKWEELRLEAYMPTPNDVWTIGWGHTAGVFPGMKITRAQAQDYFDEDVAWAVRAVNELVKVPMTQNQFDATVSLVFNIGRPNFSKSTMLKRLNARDYEGAAEALTWWNKQKGKTLRGLVRRRAEEKEYFLSDKLVEETKMAKADSGDSLKSLGKSKEMIAGGAATLTGVLGGIGTLAEDTQTVVVTALVVALVGYGLFTIYNRVKARRNGER